MGKPNSSTFGDGYFSLIWIWSILRFHTRRQSMGCLSPEGLSAASRLLLRPANDGKLQQLESRCCAALGGSRLRHLGHRLCVMALILRRGGREGCCCLGKPATGSSFISWITFSQGKQKVTLQNPLFLLPCIRVTTEHQLKRARLRCSGSF